MEKIRFLALKMFYPFLLYVNKIGIPRRLTTEETLWQAAKVLKPGHVILARKRLEASNLLLSGFWSHAAMYIGNNRVIEAVGSGVRVVGLAGFIFSEDYINILEPTFADDSTMQIAADHAKTLEGSSYDYLFQPSSQAFYCSEVVWWAYNKAMNATYNDSPFTVREVFGVKCVTPEDIAQAKTKFVSIFDSRQQKD